MKILKYLVLPLVLLVGIYCLLCVLGPKNFNLERTIEIDAPKNMAYNIVNNIESWEQWGSWQKRDTGMVISYPGKTVGVGAKSEWISASEGNGKQEIIESVPSERLRTQLNFEGWDEPSYGQWHFEDKGDKSNVRWAMESSDLPFLMRGMMMVMGMKGQIKENYDESLASLKEMTEDRAKNGTYSGYKINDIRLPEKHFVYTRQEVNEDRIQQFYASNLGALFAKVQSAKVEMDGMPCGLFYNFNDRNGTIDMAAAIPTKESLIIPDASSVSLPAKRALQVDYFGDYHNTELAHEAIEAYMKDKGIFNDSPVIEEYITDPTVVKDPEKWLTKVTYYVSD